MSYVTCPKCNEVNSDSSAYCASCGESLRGARVMETSDKNYVKSGDWALQKAQEGEYHCVLFGCEQSTFMDGKLFPGYSNFISDGWATQVNVREDGIHFKSITFIRGKLISGLAKSTVGKMWLGFTSDMVANETRPLDLAWADVKGIAVKNNSNHIYLFYDYAKKKRLEWLDFMIGVELEMSVKCGVEPEFERKSTEIFLEKCRAKSIPITLLD